MATTYNDTQIAIIDSSGNISVIYPRTKASLVSLSATSYNDVESCLTALGTAAFKNTSDTYNATGTTVATTKAVYDLYKATATLTSSRNTSDTYIPVISYGNLDYTKRVIVDAVTNSLYNTEQDRIPTLSFLSYWNGAYNSSGSSNLQYCNKGKFQNGIGLRRAWKTWGTSITLTDFPLTSLGIFAIDTNRFYLISRTGSGTGNFGIREVGASQGTGTYASTHSMSGNTLTITVSSNATLLAIWCSSDV